MVSPEDRRRHTLLEVGIAGIGVVEAGTWGLAPRLVLTYLSFRGARAGVGGTRLGADADNIRWSKLADASARTIGIGEASDIACDALTSSRIRQSLEVNRSVVHSEPTPSPPLLAMQTF